MNQSLIVAVVSKKGGVGKSTVDVNFAIKLAFDGKKVCIVDLDSEQYTAARHLTRRDNARIMPAIAFHATTYDKVEKLISDLSNEFDIIFIETAGEMSKQVRKAISVADLIITYLQPFASEFETIPLIEEVITNLINEGLSSLEKVPALIIPNRIAFYQRAGLLNLKKENNPLVALLNRESELKYFKFTKNYIKDRPTLYGRAYELGKAIFELKPEEISTNKKEGAVSINKGTQELDLIYNEVFYGE